MGATIKIFSPLLLSTATLLDLAVEVDARPFHDFHHWYWGSPLVEFYPDFPDRTVIIDPNSSAYQDCEVNMPPRIAASGPAARMSWLNRCEYDIHHYGRIIE